MNVVRRNQLLYFAVAIILGVIGYRGLNKQVAPPGTPLAARFLAAKYVGMTQSVDPVRVNDAPIIEGNRATAKAVFGKGAECTVRMVRAESEKEYGWMVEASACGSAR